ncbi:FecR family protein [Pedobacter frigoris]|uniref:FecR family protein n=1 Tax=Pedobacter frigoris TaxID=2571272 RepID=UPI00292F9328|nr:FecR domain-containing protein [Pedobacter frigoris]
MSVYIGMNINEAKSLLEKYNRGKASKAESALLKYWFLHEATQQEAELSEEEYEQIHALMWKLVAEGINKPVRRKLWPRIAAVAAAVALIVLGVYFFNAPSRHSDPALSSRVSRDLNDIAPGKNGATITLANGKVIQLSDAKSGVVIGTDKLAYNDGSSALSSRANAKDLNKDMTASTTKGQTYIFTLPDGTKVWLNAASTLTIPSNFSGIETRKISLEGEAYFEVAKNKKRPFVVESNGQEVTVLGTHFNVSAYADEGSIKTTLLEGSVSVRHAIDGRHPELVSGSRNGKTTPASPPLLAKEGTILKPGQQSVVSGSNRINVKDVDVSEAVAWKDGKFMFESSDIQSIMRMVERWYNVEVIYNGEIPKDRIYGTVSRFDKVSSVLRILESTGGIHFKVEGRKIYVSK